MDRRYLQASDDIRYAKCRIQRVYDKGPYKEFEDKIAVKVIEHLIENLEDAERILEHYNKPTKTGVLVEQPNERFVIDFDYGGSSEELTCGDRLEAFLEDDIENDIELGWNAGQVEYRHGYVFIVPHKAKYRMYTGMKVRLRVEE